MKINGEIGQEVLLSGRIKKILVAENGLVEYCVTVAGSDFSFWLTGSDIAFTTMKEVLDEELSAEEPIFSDPDKEWEIRDENATECDNNATDCDNTATVEEYNDDLIPDSASGLPVDDEWSRPAPKKRGRPRKATVEDLMKRANE